MGAQQDERNAVTAVNIFIGIVFVALLVTLSVLVVNTLIVKIIFAFVGAGCYLYYLHATGVDKGRENVVIRKGTEYVDIGPGVFYFAVPNRDQEILSYDTKTRITTWEVRLPTKTGQQLFGDFHVSWKPDPDSLREFFENQETLEEQIRLKGNVALQAWAKERYPEAVYKESPAITIDVPGIRIFSTDLTEVETAMSSPGIEATLPKDYAQGIDRIVRTVASFEELRRVKERLLGEATSEEAKAFIEIHIQDHENKMRAEGVK